MSAYLNDYDKYLQLQNYAKKHTFDNIISKSIKQNRSILGKLGSISDIIKTYGDDLQKSTNLIAYLPESAIDVNQLKSFLVDIFENNSDILEAENKSTRSNIRRLIRIYDYLAWGKKKR